MNYASLKDLTLHLSICQLGVLSTLAGLVLYHTYCFSWSNF